MCLFITGMCVVHSSHYMSVLLPTIRNSHLMCQCLFNIEHSLKTESVKMGAFIPYSVFTVSTTESLQSVILSVRFLSVSSAWRQPISRVSRECNIECEIPLSR